MSCNLLRIKRANIKHEAMAASGHPACPSHRRQMMRITAAKSLDGNVRPRWMSQAAFDVAGMRVPGKGNDHTTLI